MKEVPLPPNPHLFKNFYSQKSRSGIFRRNDFFAKRHLETFKILFFLLHLKHFFPCHNICDKEKNADKSS